jgi:ABC-type metal ion transport system, periplasmic component/surface adhesin
MSPRNAQVYVDNMVEAFSALDPGHADEFAENAAAYKEELQAVQDELTASLDAFPRTSARS